MRNMATTAAALFIAVAAFTSAAADEKSSVAFLNSSTVLPRDVPLSEAVRVGNMLYLSGQVGNKPGTLELVSGGIRTEARQAMQNIKTILEANGYKLSDVVKCTVMLADISEWGLFNEVYREFFATRFPARSAFGANGLALGARVEVECMAAAAP